MGDKAKGVRRACELACEQAARWSKNFIRYADAEQVGVGLALYPSKVVEALDEVDGKLEGVQKNLEEIGGELEEMRECHALEAERRNEVEAKFDELRAASEEVAAKCARAERERDDAAGLATSRLAAMGSAWGLIANAHGGNWIEASDEWRAAAERWRDEEWRVAVKPLATRGNVATTPEGNG